jgi:hypothetical protein
VRIIPTTGPKKTPQWIHSNRTKAAAIPFHLAEKRESINMKEMVDTELETLPTEFQPELEEENLQTELPVNDVLENEVQEETETQEAEAPELPEEIDKPPEPPIAQEELKAEPKGKGAPMFFSLRSRQIPKVLSLLPLLILMVAPPTSAKIQVIPQLSIVPRGSQLELRCITTVGENDNLEWHHKLMGQEETFEEPRHTNESVLFFSRVDEANQGNYTCAHKVNGWFMETAVATVLLEIPPGECSCRYWEPLERNRTITVMCDLRASRMESWPQWKVNNRPVTWEKPHQYTSLEGFSLHYFAILDKPLWGTLWLRKTPAHDPSEEGNEPRAKYTYETPTTSLSPEIRNGRPRRWIILPRKLFFDDHRYAIETTLSVNIPKHRATTLTMSAGEACTTAFRVQPLEFKHGELICGKPNVTIPDTDIFGDENEAARKSSAIFWNSGALVLALVYLH